MRSHHRRRIVSLAIAAMLAAPSATSAAPPARGEPSDITATARGRMLAREAAARFIGYGFRADAADLAVHEDARGNVLVAPAWLADTAATRVGTGGRLSATIDVGGSMAARPRSAVHRYGAGRAAAIALAAPPPPYWTTRERACFASIPVDSARFDSCYTIDQLIHDGSTSLNYYTLRHRGTAFESGSGLRSAWLSAERIAGTTAQSWIEWSPDQNYDENCHSVSVSVGFAGVGIGGSFEQCERWNITKSCNGCNVAFQNTWDCDCWFGLSAPPKSSLSRAVAYAVLVSVPSGSSPRWRLGIGLRA